MAEIEHPNLAVMFTDIKGYAALMSEDQAQALNLLQQHNQIMESVIDAHGGRVVKKLGDAYMVMFDDADVAVKCGLHALAKMEAQNKDGTLFEIRIGIHEGAMIEREGDFFGENVNIAARLEQLASPMSIAATERVVQHIASRIKAEARLISTQMLKHIRYPVTVYEIRPAESWKLYLGKEEVAAETDSADILGAVTSADQAWQEVDNLVLSGNLQQATSVGEAALSRFGGTFLNYAYLAGLYMIAGLELEAEAALKRGHMLGQKSDQDSQLDWLGVLIRIGQDGLKERADELNECLAQAQHYNANHPTDLAMRVLSEGIKARSTGSAAGMATLAQANQTCALVLRGYAEALKDLGEMADAYSLLEQTINVAPQVVDHQLRRVEWMVDSEDVSSVLSETEQLAGQFPNEPSVYVWTGKTRLLNLDPFGAQWIFEQGKEGGGVRQTDSSGWLITSLMQQGRFEQGVEAARKEMRNAIRQNRQRMARIYFKMATTGMYLQHWDNVLDIAEEYKRYDTDWLFPQAAIIVAKHTRKLIPWDRAIAQLDELSADTADFPHPSGWVFAALLPAVRDQGQWTQLHELEFFAQHRDWLLQSRNTEAIAALEARGALLYNAVDTWHVQLVPILTRLRSRLDHRLPSFLAVAGLIETRLNNFEGGKTYMEQARKLWRNADWPVWEIQETESALAAGASAVTSEE